jgi:diguanylate cyclase (GGDEF)-like protein
MKEVVVSGRKRSWFRPLGDPMAWSAADKCLLVVAVMLPGVGLFALMRATIPGWFYMPAELLEEAEALVTRLTLLAAGVWTAMAVAGLILRKHAPDNRTFVVLTVLLYSLTIAIFVCLSGAFHSPGWILFLGGAVLGFLLFGRALTLYGIGLFIVVFTAAVLASEAGYLGRIMIVTQPPPTGDPAWSAWLIRMGVSTAVFGTLTLALCAYVIAMLRDREARLDRMAKVDGLTDLYNRRHFMELIAGEVARAKRYKSSLSVVMIDLDHFKEINDEHGHLAGDKVLASVAGGLAGCVRDTDFVARYGGEEFVLLLPSTGPDGARELAERAREVVSRMRIPVDDGELSVTASMGIASFPEDVEADVDALVGAADDALYRAKDGGRNRVEMAS